MPRTTANEASPQNRRARVANAAGSGSFFFTCSGASAGCGARSGRHCRADHRKRGEAEAQTKRDCEIGRLRDEREHRANLRAREGKRHVHPNVFPFAGSLGKNAADRDRKSTRLNSSHSQISYAVFCLKKKKKTV